MHAGLNLYINTYLYTHTHTHMYVCMYSINLAFVRPFWPMNVIYNNIEFCIGLGFCILNDCGLHFMMMMMINIVQCSIYILCSVA